MPHDLDAGLVVLGVPTFLRASLARKQAPRRRPGRITFLNRGAGCMHGVIDAVPCASFTSISSAPPTRKYRYTAGELGEPLLELLAIIVRGGFLDLPP